MRLARLAFSADALRDDPVPAKALNAHAENALVLGEIGLSCQMAGFTYRIFFVTRVFFPLDSCFDIEFLNRPDVEDMKFFSNN